MSQPIANPPGFVIALLLPMASAHRRRDVTILLLFDARESAKEHGAAVLSVYVSGVDVLLTKPLAT